MSIPLEPTFKQNLKGLAQELSTAPTPTAEVKPTPTQPLTETQKLNAELDKLEGKVPPAATTTTETTEEIIEQAAPAAPISEKAITSEVNADKLVNEEALAEFEFDNDEDREFIQNIYGKKEEATPAAKKEGTEGKAAKPTEEAEEVNVVEKYQPYIEKATEYETLLSDPLTKAFIEFRKNGGVDPNEFIRQTGIVSVESMTPEQLMEADFKANGLTAEEIEVEMESFKEKSPYEKKKLTNAIKDELVKQRDEKLKTFTGQSEQSQKVMADAIKRGTAELDSVIPKMEGKKYKGLLITPEMAKKVKQDVVQNPIPKFDTKGQFIGFDIQESIRRSVILNFDEQRSKSLIEMGKTMGADMALKLRNRPVKKEVGTPLIPSTVKTLDAALEGATDKMWQKRGVKKP